MNALGLIGGGLSGKTILCVGAHSDDIEIGCGGTLRRVAASNDDLSIHWVVLSAGGRREEEARASAEEILSPVRTKSIVMKQFRNGFFPYVATEIKEYFESLKAHAPDVVLCHCRHDMHQDHRLVGELAWNTFRNHVILEYEIPKYDADLRAPNVFVTLTEQDLDSKISGLLRHFGSQQDKQWFTDSTFRAIARLRGIECAASTGYAEAFYARKLVLD